MIPESAARALGIGGTITLDGVEYRMRPVGAKHYAEVEQQLLKDRPDPMVLAKEKLPMFDDPTVKQEIIKQALRMSLDNIVTGDEVQRYMNSVPGSIFVLWLLVRGSDKPSEYECTLEFVQEAIANQIDEAIAQNRTADEVLEELQAQINSVSGEGVMGNSTGRISTGTNISTSSPESGKNSNPENQESQSEVSLSPGAE